MTALKQYARLETVGLWRPAPGMQRREVIVSFGAVTLVMSDTSGRALTHWSLPATLRLNPGESPALFSPDEAGDEVLEIEDETMVEAIERVRHALAHTVPHPGRLRQVSLWGLALVLVLGGVFWLPGALTRQAEASLPAATRTEIGAMLLGHLQRVTGPTCREPLGMVALGRLSLRLFGPGGVQIVVVRQGLAAPQALPGGIVVLPLSVLAASDDAAVAAGHVVSTALGPGGQDPLASLLDTAGLGVTLRLLARGTLPDDVLAQAAADLALAPGDLPPATALAAAFDAAHLSPDPYLRSVDPDGRLFGTLPAREPDAPDGGPDAAPPVVLSDGDWLALQGICDV